METIEKSRPRNNGPNLSRINWGNSISEIYSRNNSIPAKDVSPFDWNLSTKLALTRDFRSDLLNRTGSVLWFVNAYVAKHQHYRKLQALPVSNYLYKVNFFVRSRLAVEGSDSDARTFTPIGTPMIAVWDLVDLWKLGLL